MVSLTKKIEFLFSAVYALFLPIIHKKPRRVIMFYHSVKKDEVKSFETQMAFLVRKHRVVKPSDIKTARAGDAKILVAITFDDAFASVLENAVPVLKKYGLPAGISVPLGNLAQPPHWEMPDNCSCNNETVMSKEQILELDREGFEVSSHTVSHSVLTKLDDNRLRLELVKSKQTLEDIVGHEVIGISYPYGAFDARVCQAAKQAGYKFGFTIEPRIVDRSTHNLKIGRFAVSARDSLLEFKLKASGAYQVTSYLRAMKAQVFGILGKRRSFGATQS